MKKWSFVGKGTRHEERPKKGDTEHRARIEAINERSGWTGCYNLSMSQATGAAGKETKGSGNSKECYSLMRGPTTVTKPHATITFHPRARGKAEELDRRGSRKKDLVLRPKLIL